MNGAHALHQQVPAVSAVPADPVASESGNMGLRGWWALVGNSTAMTLIAVSMFLFGFAAWSMHKDGMKQMKDINDLAWKNTESMGKVVDRNTDALDRLTREIHMMRGGK